VDNAVEICYAGVGIGRSTLLRDWSSAGAFIGFPEPMPTGTPLRIEGEGIDQAARVVEVIESADLALAGMRVEFVRPAQLRPSPEPEPEAVQARSEAAPPVPVAAPAQVSGSPPDPHFNDEESGSGAGLGKRRRRRK
jgi:hypothetical protein